MRLGIKAKFAAVLSLILALTASLVGFVVITHQSASLNELMRSMAGTITSEFAGNSKMPFMQKDNLALQTLVRNILGNPGITDAYILDENFNIEWHGDVHEPGRPFEDGQRLFSAVSGRPPWVLKEGKGLLTLASPIVFKGETAGYAVITFSKDFIGERVSFAIKSVAMVAVFAIILVSLSSIPIASRLLRPLFTLFKGTREVAVGNLDYRIPETRRDELGDLVASFNRMASELKKKELLKGMFNRYLSGHLADEILNNPESVRLGGERRSVTVFFADIRGFTAFSRAVEPEVTVETLNLYFSLITNLVFRFEGTVDKFMGDAVMTVFGSPLKTARHLENGLKAAFAVRHAVEGLNRMREGAGLAPLKMGIGLDSGEVIVGNMGSKMRMEYTAVGDSVNMASRLTDLSMGGEVTVSENVYVGLEDVLDAEPIEGVSLKGVDGMVTVYRVRGLKGPWGEEAREAAEGALQGFKEEAAVL